MKDTEYNVQDDLKVDGNLFINFEDYYMKNMYNILRPSKIFIVEGE